MNIAKTALCAAAAVALFTVAPMAAQATTFTTVGTPGGGPESTVHGNDPFGGVYTVEGGSFTGGLYSISESAGAQPDPTQQVLFNPGSSGLRYATSFSITETGGVPFLSLDRGFGVFFETFNPDSTSLSDWDATESADGRTVTFTAQPGTQLMPGQRFDFDATFSGPLPSGFGYSFSWAGPIPEPATWGLMIAGLGMMGGVLRRKRTQTLAV